MEQPQRYAQPAFQVTNPLAHRHVSGAKNQATTRFAWPSHTTPARRRVIPVSPTSVVLHRVIPTASVKQSKWANLTVGEFDSLLDSGGLALCFIGMSNCGKSHWSHQLHNHCNFSLVSVDDDIEISLEDILSGEGHVGIGGLADWMGFPSEDRFASNQATYLTAEESITSTAAVVKGQNCVLDTTGSVVYLSETTRNKLMEQYLVIHLEASDDLLHVMTENYFQTPKPVVWGDAYNRQDGETVDDALRRCYPTLLQERRARYARMAHVTIPASKSLSPILNVHGFLNVLRSYLPAKDD